jgi:WD40 repeat protein
VHITTLKGHSDLVYSVTFSPNGSHIASGSRDGTVRIWDAKTSVHLATPKNHSHAVTSLTFSPNGSHIASGLDNNTAQIWDAQTGVHISTVKHHSNHPLLAVFSQPKTGITSHNVLPQAAVSPGPHSCMIELQSPGWLVISGHINTRIWLPAGYSEYSHHRFNSLYGDSVVVGTYNGLLILLQPPHATSSSF